MPGTTVRRRLSRFLANFFFEHRQKIKKFLFRARHLVLIYNPKEAHSRIFVTGGSVIAWQILAEKSSIPAGRPACSFPRPKKYENSPWLKTGCARPLLKKNLRCNFYLLLLFRLILSEILSLRCRLSRTTRDPAKKSGKNRQAKIRKLRVFTVISGEQLARFCHAVLEFREHPGLPPD